MKNLIVENLMQFQTFSTSRRGNKKENRQALLDLSNEFTFAGITGARCSLPVYYLPLSSPSTTWVLPSTRTRQDADRKSFVRQACQPPSLAGEASPVSSAERDQTLALTTRVQQVEPTANPVQFLAALKLIILPARCCSSLLTWQNGALSRTKEKKIAGNAELEISPSYPVLKVTDKLYNFLNFC